MQHFITIMSNADIVFVTSDLLMFSPMQIFYLFQFLLCIRNNTRPKWQILFDFIFSSFAGFAICSLAVFRTIYHILCIGPFPHTSAEASFWAGDPRWEWYPFWWWHGAGPNTTPSSFNPTWTESWLQELLLEDFHLLLSGSIALNSRTGCMVVFFLFKKMLMF